MSLLVNVKSRKDEKFLAELLEKLGYKAKPVSVDEIEDIEYASILKQNNPKDVLAVSEAKAYYSKLKKRK
ncbi:hypothetical protein BH11BAC7_BH11BAC7_31000 [soil metagenome]